MFGVISLKSCLEEILIKVGKVMRCPADKRMLLFFELLKRARGLQDPEQTIRVNGHRNDCT